MKRLVLASASPRRRRILRRLGVHFTATSGQVVETPHRAGESPALYVQKNAAAKARSMADRFDNALIVGADTVVVHHGRVMGKPRSMNEAFAFIRFLNGETHAVYTGLAIIDMADAKMLQGYEKTLVTFRKLSNREIRAYLEAINPLDKAGAYAIQGPGALIVEAIRGCYYNVVGFPVARLDEMLLKMGVSLFDYMKMEKQETGDRRQETGDRSQKTEGGRRKRGGTRER